VCIGPQHRFATLEAAARAAAVEHGCGALVNCTGLGAGALVADDKEAMQSGRGGTALFPRGLQQQQQQQQQQSLRAATCDIGGATTGSQYGWNTVVMVEQKPYVERRTLVERISISDALHVCSASAPSLSRVLRTRPVCMRAHALGTEATRSRLM